MSRPRFVTPFLKQGGTTPSVGAEFTRVWKATSELAASQEDTSEEEEMGAAFSTDEVEKDSHAPVSDTCLEPSLRKKLNVTLRSTLTGAKTSARKEVLHKVTAIEHRKHAIRHEPKELSLSAREKALSPAERELVGVILYWIAAAQRVVHHLQQSLGVSTVEILRALHFDPQLIWFDEDADDFISPL